MALVPHHDNRRSVEMPPKKAAIAAAAKAGGAKKKKWSKGKVKDKVGNEAGPVTPSAIVNANVFLSS